MLAEMYVTLEGEQTITYLYLICRPALMFCILLDVC